MNAITAAISKHVRRRGHGKVSIKRATDVRDVLGGWVDLGDVDWDGVCIDQRGCHLYMDSVSGMGCRIRSTEYFTLPLALLQAWAFGGGPYSRLSVRCFTIARNQSQKRCQREAAKRVPMELRFYTSYPVNNSPSYGYHCPWTSS